MRIMTAAEMCKVPDGTLYSYITGDGPIGDFPGYGEGLYITAGDGDEFGWWATELVAQPLSTRMDYDHPAEPPAGSPGRVLKVRDTLVMRREGDDDERYYVYDADDVAKIKRLIDKAAVVVCGPAPPIE